MLYDFTFADIFCGLGGFRIGLEALGGRCVFSSDNNPHIQDTYEKNFDERPQGDIRDIRTESIPEFDVLTAGFPCQPFSISGHKKGFSDTRGTLFFDICRIIESHTPKVVVLENVKHLLHHDRKQTLTKMLKTLNELGYSASVSLLNAIDFGLPQNRERVFIIASKNLCFDFQEIETETTMPLKVFLEDSEDHEYLNPEEYTLLETYKIRRQPMSGLIFCGYRNKNRFLKNVAERSLHLNRVHRQPNRIYSVEGNHPTLPSQESSGRFFIYNPASNKVRKLSIGECFRIMGFPEAYKRVSSVGEQYRQIGNSVAIPVINGIMKQIIQQGLLDNVKTQRCINRTNRVIEERQMFLTL